MRAAAGEPRISGRDDGSFLTYQSKSLMLALLVETPAAAPARLETDRVIFAQPHLRPVVYLYPSAHAIIPQCRSTSGHELGFVLRIVEGGKEKQAILHVQIVHT